MAFVRRKGNSYYLVHNVRRGGKVRQLTLRATGKRARITDEVVREVSKPSRAELAALREQMNNQLDLADAHSPAIKARFNLRALNLDADVSPSPDFESGGASCWYNCGFCNPRSGKPNQFDRKRGRFSNATADARP
jgi:hypothetical protein